MKVSKLSDQEYKDLNIDSWGVWEKEVSTFPWEYSEKESCFILEGKAKVTSESGDTIEFQKGDFVEFPEGLKCNWEITQPIKKFFKFG